MTSPYPSIPTPQKTTESMYTCFLIMKQVLQLLTINVQPPSTILSQAAQIFSTSDQHKALNQIVVIQNADLTALQSQVAALEAELASPLAVYPTPAPTQTLFHLSTAGNHLLHTGACAFAGFTVNTGQASATMTLYDGTSAAGTLLAVFDCAVTDEGSRNIPGGGWALTVGCFCVISGTLDLTVVLQ